ncbi:Rad17 cell cycle checkpoint protein-domain-containing protein [Scheffersomyces xylosifermentans]|uniref:Rad17 cell cycle checkpoint protein-domain-containing protein n=1 Tax=Scheffersomyces xylosifermentans TaxID=1304137 RepID=UPI00315C8D7E
MPKESKTRNSKNILKRKLSQPESIPPRRKIQKVSSPSSKGPKVERSSRKPSSLESVSDPNELQWIDKYAPTCSSDLCINPQKLKQVKEVLYDMVTGKSSKKLLVLTGPAGSSKSTSIKVLANEIIDGMALGRRDEYGLSGETDLLSSGFEGSDTANNRWIEYIDTGSVLGTNQSDQFDEFLTDVKYRVGPNLSVILIEELPNIFHYDTLVKFRNKIRQWIYSEAVMPPLVICLTEVEYISDEGTRDYSYNIENNLTIDTLLGKDIVNSAPVQSIKFNSIANRFVRKTIGQIIKQERTIFNQIPVKEVSTFLDEVVKIGDIRSIIFNLQMWATNYQRDQTWYTRENQINLFHAIGKVIHSSSDFEGLSKDERNYNSIEQVLLNYTNNQLLNLAILENYSIYNDGEYSISTASEIVDGLSTNDLLTGEANREYGIRSTRIQLQGIPASHTTRRARIKFPRHFKMIRQFNKTNIAIRSYQKYIEHSSFQDLNLIDGYYLPLIYNRRLKTRYSYNRLGGKFTEIFADEEAATTDEPETGNSFYDVDQFQIDITDKIAELEKGGESDEEGELSEEIENSDEDDSFGDDDDLDEGFSSDPELDVLISQGRV